MGGGDLSEVDKQAAKEILDEFADRAQVHIAAFGLPPHASVLWKSWSMLLILDADKIIAGFSANVGGMADLKWLDRKSERFPPQELVRAAREELGWSIDALVVLPLPSAADRSLAIDAAAQLHAADVERANRLGRLGDLTGIQHLEPHLREFLQDHPDPDKNVFVMMRFQPTAQLEQVHATIKESLAARGFHAVRADDRDYTGELWSNIEVYMACSRFGIAVFEAIDAQDFNPNVSLELGYMLGRRKRVLILKEQRLPNLPADVVHRLYKPFDMFNIESSVAREVGRWVDVDLGLGLGAA
jgi:hypothetical protein